MWIIPHFSLRSTMNHTSLTAAYFQLSMSCCLFWVPHCSCKTLGGVCKIILGMSVHSTDADSHCLSPLGGCHRLAAGLFDTHAATELTFGKYLHTKACNFEHSTSHRFLSSDTNLPYNANFQQSRFICFTKFNEHLFSFLRSTNC